MDIFKSNDVAEIKEEMERTLGWPIDISRTTTGQWRSVIRVHRSQIFSFVDADISSDVILKRTKDRPDNISILLIRRGGYEISGTTKSNLDGSPIAIIDIRKTDYLKFTQDSNTHYVTISKERLRNFIYKITGKYIRIDIENYEVLNQDNAFTGLLYSAFNMHYDFIKSENFRTMDTLDLSEELCLSLLAEYMIKKSGFEENATYNSIKKSSFNEILDYCEASGDPILVSELAEFFNISVRTLEKSFQQYTSITPHAYLKGKRLSAVRKELQAGGPSQLNESAKHWGFSNITRLRSDFVAMFGIDEWKKLTARR